MAARNFHEDLARHGDEPRASERNLGVTFAVVLALVGALKLYRGSEYGLYWFALLRQLKRERPAERSLRDNKHPPPTERE